MAPAPAGGSLRPARAAHRYRPGQAPAGYAAPEDESKDDSEEEEQQDKPQQKKKLVPQGPIVRNDGLQIISQGAALPRQMKVQVTTNPDQAAAAQRAKDGKPASRPYSRAHH